jgi:tetratricopeptide (TPR) repeat protein
MRSRATGTGRCWLRRLVLGLALLATAGSPAFAGQGNNTDLAAPHLVQLTDPRIDRVQEWLKAVLHHRPGEADDAANLVASWSNADMRTLRMDVSAIVQVMRHGDVGPDFDFTDPGQTRPAHLRYPPDQYRKLKVLTCAAGGSVVGAAMAPGDKLPRLCEEVRATEALDAELKRLAVAVNAAKVRGDHDNYILRHGALLHADIALLPRRPNVPLATGGAPALGGGVTLAMSDGEGVMESGQVAIHLDLARMLLDQVVPPRRAVVAPAEDDMVRHWYVATAAWMQQTQQYMTNHLSRARALFPRDADILFLSGCEREIYASPAIQSAIRSVSPALGVDFQMASDQSELRAAEGFFRGALASKPDFGEAHLHLGHVLLLRGRAADAATELQHAIASLTDTWLQYYAELFDGAALESTGQFDRARAAYAKAAELSPTAQSPRLALSALARRRGDRAVALSALQDVFAVPIVDPAHDDPWWAYVVAQARNTDALLAALRRPFLEQTP